MSLIPVLASKDVITDERQRPTPFGTTSKQWSGFSRIRIILASRIRVAKNQQISWETHIKSRPKSTKCRFTVGSGSVLFTRPSQDPGQADTDPNQWNVESRDKGQRLLHHNRNFSFLTKKMFSRKIKCDFSHDAGQCYPI